MQATTLPNDIRGDGERRHGDISKQRIRVLENIIDLVETEGDRGGGGGGGENRNSIGDGLDKIDTTSRKKNPSCSNSVLMNLLVSGCDVSAGYVCLVKPKPTAKGIGNA